MLQSCIQEIGRETERLQSLVSSVRSGWNDGVSAHVERTYLDALIHTCDSFYSAAFTTETVVRNTEETLRQIADKY